MNITSSSQQILMLTSRECINCIKCSPPISTRKIYLVSITKYNTDINIISNLILFLFSSDFKQENAAAAQHEKKSLCNMHTTTYTSYDSLTLALLNLNIPCLCKQCRSRSVGFFRSQLIWICTVCLSDCEFKATTWIKLSDWLTIRSGRVILIQSA